MAAVIQYLSKHRCKQQGQAIVVYILVPYSFQIPLAFRVDKMAASVKCHTNMVNIACAEETPCAFFLIPTYYQNGSHEIKSFFHNFWYELHQNLA